MALVTCPCAFRLRRLIRVLSSVLSYVCSHMCAPLVLAWLTSRGREFAPGLSKVKCLKAVNGKWSDSPNTNATFELSWSRLWVLNHHRAIGAKELTLFLVPRSGFHPVSFASAFQSVPMQRNRPCLEWNPAGLTFKQQIWESSCNSPCFLSFGGPFPRRLLLKMANSEFSH